MRDAALMIAALGDDFAPNLLQRLLRRLDAAVGTFRKARAARRHLRHLHELDPRLLDDVGLSPTDLATLDPEMSALEATRSLARSAATRRGAEDRWMRN